MLGSTADAEDAVQDTLLRGWRSLDRFEGRSSLKSWLYRIATNVCHDALRRRQRRPRPVDVSDDGIAGVGYDDARVVPADVPDPADVVVERDAVRRAFVAALGHISPRQHAVVILRDVLRWEAGRGCGPARHDPGRGEQHAPTRALHPRHARTTAPTDASTPQ